MEVIDILCDRETGDIACQNGDFAIGDATIQHQGDLLSAAEGEYKQSPTVGVGIQEFLNDEGPAMMLRKIREQFVNDGMTVSELALLESGLTIKANYK